MFRRSIILVRHRSGHLTARFLAGVAEAAATGPALAPAADDIMASQRNCRKSSRAGYVFILRG